MSVPGLPLARTMNSLSVFTGTDLCTTSMTSPVYIGATGTKSRSSWNGLLVTRDSLVAWVCEMISSV